MVKIPIDSFSVMSVTLPNVEMVSGVNFQTLNVSAEKVNEEKLKQMKEDEDDQCEIRHRDLQCPSCYDNTQMSKKHCMG